MTKLEDETSARSREPCLENERAKGSQGDVRLTARGLGRRGGSNPSTAPRRTSKPSKNRREKGQMGALEFWRAKDLERRARSSPGIERLEVERSGESPQTGGESLQSRDQRTPEEGQGKADASDPQGSIGISPGPAKPPPGSS